MADKKGTCESCRRKGLYLTSWIDMNLCSTCKNLASAIRNHKDTVTGLFTRIHGEELRADAGSSATQAEIDYNLDLLDKISVALGGVPADEMVAAVKRLIADHWRFREEVREGRAAMACVLEVSRALWRETDSPERPGALAEAVRRLVAERDALIASMLELEERAKAAPAGPAAEIKPGDQYRIPKGYESLMAVLVAAVEQAANGKGKERHATPVPFERQASCQDARAVGIGFPLGQAMKKARECLRLHGGHRRAEILGAIVYLAIAYIVDKEADVPGWPALPADQEPAAAFSFAEGGGHD